MKMWYDYSDPLNIKLNESLLEAEEEKFYKGQSSKYIESDFYRWEQGFEYAVNVGKGKTGYGAKIFSVGVGEDMSLSYSPERNKAWVYNFMDNGFVVRFYVKNWKEVEKLRFQLNRGN